MVMPTRSQVGSARQPRLVRPTYNTFKPRSEWSNTAESKFLYVYLSGFTKEQVKVTWDASTQLIRVQGQRPISTYRWTRFEDFFPVPESCDASKLKTSFFNGLLTVELPIVGTSTGPDQTGEEETKPVQEKGPATDQKPIEDPSRETAGKEGESQKGEEDESRKKTDLREETGQERHEDENVRKRSEKGKGDEPGKEPSRIEIQEERVEDEKTEQRIEKGKAVGPGKEPAGTEIQTERAEDEKTELRTEKVEDDKPGKEHSRTQEIEKEKGQEESSQESALTIDKDQKIDDGNSLVNVVAASLVIMGLGVYLYGQFVKFIK